MMKQLIVFLLCICLLFLMGCGSRENPEATATPTEAPTETPEATETPTETPTGEDRPTATPEEVVGEPM